MLPENDDTFLSRWLEGSLSAAEREEFERSEKGQQFRDILAATDMLRPSPFDVEASYAKLKGQLPPKQSKPREAKVRGIRPYMIYASAAAVITAVAAFFLFFYVSTLSTGTGEQLSASLPDGSVVELHANSSLRYRKWGFEESCEVRLDGEAFFQVERGEGFNVLTSNGNVRVLGTTFNVKTRAEKLEVACYTGKVQVNSGGINEPLEAGNALQIFQGQKTKTWNVPPDARPEWQSGQTHFEQVAFAEVVEELEALFNIEIIEVQPYRDLRYTGTIPHSSVEAALKLVMEPLNLQYNYNRSARTVRISSKR